jgi:hypothetical protein
MLSVLYSLADLCQRTSQRPPSRADSRVSGGPRSGRGSYSGVSGDRSGIIVEPYQEDHEPSQESTQGESSTLKSHSLADAAGDPVSQAPSSEGHPEGEFTEAPGSHVPHTAFEAIQCKQACKLNVPR